MSVSGAWVNIYGSVVYLTQYDGGFVAGVYTSTTGSSGAYWVAGYADPNPPAGGTGETLAFSILWRSFAGGKPDPSWHYVSGLSGQMVAVDGTPSLVMIHDMVVTVPDPGVVTVPGDYLDKLTYTPYSGPAISPGEWPPAFSPPPADPVNGNWTCVQDPALRLSIEVQDSGSGFLTGVLTTADGTSPLVGFTDTDSGLPVQGLTFSALLPDGKSVVAMPGVLDFASDALSLTKLLSNATAGDSTWMQTRFKALDFRRS